MTTYIIIERLGHMDDGLMPHDVTVDGIVQCTNISYLAARDYVEVRVEPKDTVIERYESTGTEVSAIGRLPD